MTRKEVYEIIKKNNLNDAVSKFFGVNYTRVKTDALEKFLCKYHDVAEGNVKKREKKEECCCEKDGKMSLVDKLFNKTMTDFATMVNSVQQALNDGLVHTVHGISKPEDNDVQTAKIFARLLAALTVKKVLTYEECRKIMNV